MLEATKREVNQIKRDAKKFKISLPFKAFDKRRKDYRQYIESFGGELNALKHVNSLLNEVQDYVKISKIRTKQVVIQKRYNENKRNKQIKNANIIKRFLRKNQTVRNKIFHIKPSTWKNVYKQYKINNDINRNEALTLEDFKYLVNFYKIKEFLIQKLKDNCRGFKVNLGYSAILEDTETGKYFDYKRTLKGVNIYNLDNINSAIQELYDNFNQVSEKSYTVFKDIETFYVLINNTKSLTGKSYIPLPSIITNKKAVINIKNEDCNCFLYSVLCGYLNIYEKEHPERVTHYKGFLDKLKYDANEMPMKIDKISYFEKRNNIQINLFGYDIKNNNLDIYPLYVSCNRGNQDCKIINLLYISDDDKGHYCYIKNFNRLMCVTNDKNSNLVCPYCCEFKTYCKETFDKHTKYCISGQKVEMPNKVDKIKFDKYSYLNKCPIRIYSDFESCKDTSNKSKSKNGKSEFIDKHIPVSFKILIVSDIPISLQYKLIGCNYTYEFIYKGTDSNDAFIYKIQELEDILVNDLKNAQKLYSNYKNMIISNDEIEKYKNSKRCNVCDSEFYKDGKFKVRHHNHFTGRYSCALCSKCNLQIKDKIHIPVFFHNLNYDKNLFFTSLYKLKNVDKISILPDNDENYKCFSIGGLHFIDTFKFMSSSLDTLIKNLPDDNKIFLKSLCKTELEWTYMNKKGYFPYDWFDDINKFNQPIEQLKSEYFNNSMSLEKINNDEWTYIQKLISDLNIKTFEDYHDFYLNIDVNGLADVFENFINTSITTYKLDPCYFVGAPAFAWNSMLLLTKVELELLKDSEMYQFYERGIRGGMSIVVNKHSKANNKYLPGYDDNEKSKYIMYLDANNLYGWSMVKKLPVCDFKWMCDLTKIDSDFILNYNEETNEYGYTLEVDLEYPRELHDRHNDYPLAPERYKPEGSSNYKLCGTLLNKTDYIVDIRNLQLYLQQGLIIKKIHRVIQYKQSNWLKPWIDINTNYRQKAKNDFEKDYFKLMNNAVFGKTMENVRDRKDIKISFDEDYFLKYSSKPVFNHAKVLVDDEMILLNLDKKSVKLDKPIYAGFTILDLSKYHMYNFHYNIMKNKYDDKINLLLTDTDSLVYEIETEDIYQDMFNNKELFDMSEYSKTNKFYDATNNKVLGKFKDETKDFIIAELVAIRSKVYSFKTNDCKEKKVLKGIPKPIVKKSIHFEDYKKCVLENQVKIADNIISFRTKDLSNYTLKNSKIALKNKDDKRVWSGISSYAYGHYKLNEMSNF